MLTSSDSSSQKSYTAVSSHLLTLLQQLSHCRHFKGAPISEARPADARPATDIRSVRRRSIPPTARHDSPDSTPYLIVLLFSSDFFSFFPYRFGARIRFSDIALFLAYFVRSLSVPSPVSDLRRRASLDKLTNSRAISTTRSLYFPCDRAKRPKDTIIAEILYFRDGDGERQDNGRGSWNATSAGGQEDIDDWRRCFGAQRCGCLGEYLWRFSPFTDDNQTLLQRSRAAHLVAPFLLVRLLWDRHVVLVRPAADPVSLQDPSRKTVFHCTTFSGPSSPTIASPSTMPYTLRKP